MQQGELKLGKKLPQEPCPCCGAKMVAYSHKLNKGLISALLKLHKAGGSGMLCDIGLTKSEYCNFQKLRYWDFVKKARVDNDQGRGGSWSITNKGLMFVLDKESAYKKVITYRGETEKFDGEQVYASDIVDNYEYRADYARQAI